MSETSQKIERPLSPHLQIYRPQMTSMLSIFHRASGVALSIGTLMVVWWLVAAATGPDAYQQAMDFANSTLGLFMIAGWSFALYYHLCNGIRHLIWDTGRLMKIRAATRAGYLVFYGALLLTAMTWGYVLKPKDTNLADLMVTLGEEEPMAGDMSMIPEQEPKVIIIK